MRSLSHPKNGNFNRPCIIWLSNTLASLQITLLGKIEEGGPGLGLPPSLYQDETFESKVSPVINDDILLAGRLRAAMITIAKRAADDEEGSEDETDEKY